jgi:hypothetical protein
MKRKYRRLVPWLLLAAAVFLLSAVAMNARDGDELKVHGSLVQFQDVRAQTKEFMDTYRSERWTPSFGQVFGSAQVESGFMVQVALGCGQAGQRPSFSERFFFWSRSQVQRWCSKQRIVVEASSFNTESR